MALQTTRLKIQHFFDSAHQLKDTEDLITKGCANLHGHTYKAVIHISSTKLLDNGMVIDFSAVKKTVDILDHRFINDVFKEQNYDFQPTAENIAVFLADKINEVLPEKAIVNRLELCEGYKGEDKASWAIYEV